MSDCIAYETKMIRWIIEHRHVTELREIPGAFLLYFDPKTYYTIPKRSFSEGQVAQFRDLVTKNEYKLQMADSQHL
jgi:hypothetical protein